MIVKRKPETELVVVSPIIQLDLGKNRTHRDIFCKYACNGTNEQERQVNRTRIARGHKCGRI